MPCDAYERTLIGEEIYPLQEEFDYSSSAPGEPALPHKFRWRQETIELYRILKKWKSTSGCRHGSRDQYVRKHWYEIKTTDNRVMTISFDRHFRDPHAKRRRWWLFSLTAQESDRETEGGR